MAMSVEEHVPNPNCANPNLIKRVRCTWGIPSPGNTVNMHVWWAKQEEYSDELDDLEEAAAEARGKPAKAAAGAGASTGTASATGGKGATTGGGGDAVDDGRSTDAGVDSDKKPLSADARLAKARKDASTALAREKKTRYLYRDRDVVFRCCSPHEKKLLSLSRGVTSFLFFVPFSFARSSRIRRGLRNGHRILEILCTVILNCLLQDYLFIRYPFRVSHESAFEFTAAETKRLLSFGAHEFGTS